MLDRWRLAIVFGLFGFLASAAMIVNNSMGNLSDLETRLGWVINVACPAHLLIMQFFPYENNETPTMMMLMFAQTVVNAAAWFFAGAILTRILGR